MPPAVGDSATRTLTLTHATKPVTQLSIRVVRQDGETVLEGEAWCYTFSAKDL